jgi:PilZ domain
MKNPNAKERRRLKRQNISYYLAIKDNQTDKIIGHLVDISPAGLLMDSKVPIQTNDSYDLHLDFMEAIGGKAWLDFTARSIWCHPDPIQPYMYYAGFEITNLGSDDLEIIKRVADKYGAG